MTRLSPPSAALGLCSAIFLLVPVCTQAHTTFSEIGGKYELERGSLTMCRSFAEVKNLGNVLPPNSISFGGVDCQFDGFALRQKFGIHSLSSDRNASIGTTVHGVSGPWTCHGSSRRWADLVFFRPTTEVNFRSPGFSTVFVFQRDVLYFDFSVFEQVPGTCTYRFSSKFNETTNSKTSEPNPNKRPIGPANRGGVRLWVWLGPVLGAFATVGAALVIVYLCRGASSSSSAFVSNHGEEVVNTNANGDFRVRDRSFWRWTAQEGG